jgi:hypothetical protein
MAGYVYYSELLKNAHLDALATELAGGCIELYGGTQVSIDTSSPGTTMLLLLTKDGGAWSSGSATNGINLGTAASGSISKDSNDYEGLGAAAGTATWFRHYNVDKTMWVQGTVNTAGSPLTVTTTAITINGPVAVTTLTYRYQ